MFFRGELQNFKVNAWFCFRLQVLCCKIPSLQNLHFPNSLFRALLILTEDAIILHCPVTTGEVKGARIHIKMLAGDYFTYDVKANQSGCRCCSPPPSSTKTFYIFSQRSVFCEGLSIIRRVAWIRRCACCVTAQLLIINYA